MEENHQSQRLHEQRFHQSHYTRDSSFPSGEQEWDGYPQSLDIMRHGLLPFHANVIEPPRPGRDFWSQTTYGAEGFDYVQSAFGPQHFNTTQQYDNSQSGFGPQNHSSSHDSTPFEARRCIICYEDIGSDIASLSCGHSWCIPCIMERFSSIQNQSSWPVRCCAGYVISFDFAKLYLSKREIQRLTPLIEELEMPYARRTYCSNSRCSAHLPQTLNKLRNLTCHDCGTITCVVCKAVAHDTSTCPPPDASMQELLCLSHEKQWQRCGGCRQMIERDGGCSHMTCRCGYDFCFQCGGQIGSCRCARFENAYTGMMVRDTADQQAVRFRRYRANAVAERRNEALRTPARLAAEAGAAAESRLAETAAREARVQRMRADARRLRLARFERARVRAGAPRLEAERVRKTERRFS
ncbi:hypothetical protein AUEXF2481DRAFT_40468 [Aureobasidium subglaciale EXF-2481]|uniref:RBR-type E3 ubiquitin transferase n=1 Tax=Aureobasidium subglaciale (strain EXF-2481) TaxID=1043005 RepID=A0A074YGN3_AURSE|nr:uncharacterized protein AUEXF2481DRAFT_40468 [Aureobasidium subglaciale EXF-2481]KEQ95199.1 hypothetical protein AUEXF2481DRAFT_40468 [Aureobasidium subglaciale EXF-2481]